MANELPKQIGPYDIVEQLGKGGMAVVYRAVQTTLNRTVAVKVLPENMTEEGWIERFHREAQAVAMLNHPNIVQIIDKGEADGRLYFAMEYVPGSSLDQVMNTRRLSLLEALKIFKEVCNGLEYAHQHKIIHRDLNPRNVLVSDDLSKVKLADFGICRVEAISREMGTLSTRAVSFGTLHYLAPEQAANMVESDHRSDIFSLGVLFYAMLTGKVPVGRFNLPSRVNGEVPHEIDPIVLKCLATEPSERYQSVTLIKKDIRKLEENLRLKLVEELKGFSRSTGKILKRSTAPFSHSKSWVWLAGGVGVALLALVLFLFFWQSGTPLESQLADAGATGGAETEAGELTDPDPPTPNVDPEPPPAEPAQPTRPPAQTVRNTQPAPAPAPVRSEPSQTAGSTASSPAQPPVSADSADPPPARPPSLLNPSERGEQGLTVARREFQAGRHEAALSGLDTLLQKEPDDVSAVDALFLKAEVLRELNRLPDERAAYSEILRRFPENPRNVEAQYRLGELLRTERVEGWQQAALQFFHEVGSKDSEFTADALLRQGEIEGMLKLTIQDESLGQEVPAALATYRKLVQTYPQSSSAEYAFWSLGSMYREADQFELAAQMLTELGTRFPQTQWDAWWTAGEILEDKVRDNTRAREAYAKVPESSRNYQRAQRKLSRLKP